MADILKKGALRTAVAALACMTTSAAWAVKDMHGGPTVN